MAEQAVAVVLYSFAAYVFVLAADKLVDLIEKVLFKLAD